MPFPQAVAEMPGIWHGLRVEVAPERQPPFAVDAMVVEDDTWQVLGAEPDFRPTAEHPIRLMHELHQAEPLEPGSVIIEEGVPIHLRAIVHDLECEPSWREEWIATALKESFRIVGKHGFRALGTPLLGTRHGRLPAENSIRLLDEILAGQSARPLERLWLVFP